MILVLFAPTLTILGVLVKSVVDEHLAELMPIFERLRQQEQIPCAFPMHMGAGGTAFFRNTTRLVSLSPHTPHCHPSTHWVSLTKHVISDLDNTYVDGRM